MPAAGERWGGSGYPLRVHVRRRRMTIEGASAAEDKNGNLLGFATTDEIGSVMDMTKTRISRYGKDEKQRRVGRVAQLGQGYRERHDGDFDGGGDGGRAAPSL